MSFFNGLLFGLSTALIVGPVFFTLLRAALAEGFKAGFAVACGIIVSDIIAVSLCYGGMQFINESFDYEFWMGLAGFIILTGLGLKFLFKPDVNATVEDGKKLGWFKHFMGGFLVNFVNPTVFAIWTTLLAYAKTEFDGEQSMMMFVGGMLLGIFVTDTIKAAIAEKLRRFIKPKYLRLIFRIIGIVLIGFGLAILWNML